MFNLQCSFPINTIGDLFFVSIFFPYVSIPSQASIPNPPNPPNRPPSLLHHHHPAFPSLPQQNNQTCLNLNPSNFFSFQILRLRPPPRAPRGLFPARRSKHPGPAAQKRRLALPPKIPRAAQIGPRSLRQLRPAQPRVCRVACRQGVCF